jgi:hypothetical protein
MWVGLWKILSQEWILTYEILEATVLSLFPHTETTLINISNDWKIPLFP